MGYGNPRLIGFSGDKEVAVTVQDALFTIHSLAMLNGTDITNVARKIRRVEIKQVVNNKASVDKQPVDVISVRTLDQWEYPIGVIKRTDVSFSGNEITVPAEYNGSFVEIAYDTTIPSGKNNTITVTANNFGGTYKMVVDGIVRDLYTGNDYAGQFIAERVKIEEDYTFNFSPEGDPSVLDIPIQILKNPKGKEMYHFVLYDADDLETREAPPVVVPVDKTGLISAINVATGLDNADYTPETWSVFVQARTDAIAVRDNADATQEEVNQAVSDLATAQDQLVRV